MTSLNDINDLLINQFGPFGPLLAVGLLGLFMILLAIPLLLNQPEDPMKKLQRSMSESTRDKKPQKERLRQADRNEQLQKFASFLEPQNADELSAMELKLRQAGYQSKDSVRLFHFAQFALGLVGLAARPGLCLCAERRHGIRQPADDHPHHRPRCGGLHAAKVLDHPPHRRAQTGNHLRLSRCA